MNTPEVQLEKALDLPVPAAELWAWHARTGAFDRLAPPWQDLEIVRRNAELADGSVLEFRVGPGPAKIHWTARHEDVRPGERFVDVQERGPFAAWRHEHRFEACGEAGSRLVDRVAYRLPLGVLGRAVAGRKIAADLDAMFAWRHRTTLADLRLHAEMRSRFGDRRLRVAIAGASGTIGTALAAILSTGGHEVFRVVRRPADEPSAASPWSEIGFDGESFDRVDRLEGIDAFVDLAGENVAAGSWSPERKRRIDRSRGERVGAVVAALGRLADPPKAFLCASAVGIYGETGDRVVGEEAGLVRRPGFLAGVARRWEEAAARAAAFDARVVHLRFGVVLAPGGGALPKLLGPVPFGPLVVPGSGDQLVSWITLDDAASAVVRALHDPGLEGALNVTAPDPLPMGELVRALGRATGRPVLGRVPEIALRVALGEMAGETVLASIGAAPRRLLDAGFAFRHPDLEDALRLLLGRADSATPAAMPRPAEASS